MLGLAKGKRVTTDFEGQYLFHVNKFYKWNFMFVVALNDFYSNKNERSQKLWSEKFENQLLSKNQ